MKAALNKDTAILAAAALAGLGLIWWASRAGLVARAAQGAVGVAGDVAVGTVKGIGQVFGIPDTSMSACERALAAGNVLEASFQCPAGTFIPNAPAAVVKSIGQALGVPQTSQTQCQRDLAAGKWWDASFSCPAGTYLGAVFGSTGVSAAETADANRVEYFAA